MEVETCSEAFAAEALAEALALVGSGAGLCRFLTRSPFHASRGWLGGRRDARAGGDLPRRRRAVRLPRRCFIRGQALEFSPFISFAL